MNFIVTAAARRPASDKDECFYCHQTIGAEHKPNCVLISKNVKVRTIIEHEIRVPAFWDRELIEFARNEGAWCANNIVDELVKLTDLEDSCMCSCTKIEYIADASIPYLREE